MHYHALISPPKNFTVWGDLVKALVSHLAERFGAHEVSQWRFEVWNEPNLKGVKLGDHFIGQFWTGSQSDYFELYRHTARAVKSVNETFLVGGPASSGGQWLSELVSFCDTEKLPLDFLSCHGYPTEVAQGHDPDGMLKLTRAAVAQIPERYGGELIFSEFNSGLFNIDPFFQNHDSEFAAAFLASQMPRIAATVNRVSLLSYWTFSDIFEEIGFDSVPFHNGYGVQTVQGIPKPAYRALQILRNLSNESLLVNAPGCNASTKCPVAVFATATSQRTSGRDGETYQVLLSNFDAGRRLFPESYEVNLTLKGLQMDGVNATITRVDEENANAYTAWKQMGRPKTVTEKQIQVLVSASKFVTRAIPGSMFSPSSGGASVTVWLPPNGIALVTLVSTAS